MNVEQHIENLKASLVRYKNGYGVLKHDVYQAPEDDRFTVTLNDHANFQDGKAIVAIVFYHDEVVHLFSRRRPYIVSVKPENIVGIRLKQD